MGASNKFTAIVNFIAFLCSLPVIAAGIWLASKPDNECIHALRWPVALLGALLMAVSFAGFVGAHWNKKGLLAFYLFSMAALIAALLIILVAAFLVTRRSGAYTIPGRAFEEYRLEGFSEWLRDRVSGGNWERIRRCLAESDVCERMSQDYVTADQFFAARISPLQSGCCKPPTACGYNYVNPTMWINPVNQLAGPDCYLWGNDQSQLCYNCGSCKAGLLGNLRQEWRRANVFLIISAVLLIFVYVIGCSAYKNAQTEDLFQRYKQGYV